MTKKEIAGAISSSGLLGSGKVRYTLLLEYSQYIRIKYDVRCESKSSALMYIEKHLGFPVKLHSTDKGVWTLKPTGAVNPATISLLKGEF